MASIISTKTSGGGGIAVTGDTSGVLQLASNDGTTAVTIDASQNVGIGTGSPTSFGAGTTVLQTNAASSFCANLVSSGSYVFQAIVSQANGTLMAGSRSNHSFSICSNDTPRLTVDTSGNMAFNSGYGSVATAYGCRAWVNFNGTGTVAIRASGNVSSITDNGVGDYRVNFTTAMPDANYSVATNAGDVGSTKFDRFVTPYSLATTSVSITVRDSGGALADNPFVSVAVFR